MPDTAPKSGTASHKKPGPRRSKVEREQHRARIAELRLKGWNQYDIARELGITQSQVSEDEKVVRNRWIADQKASREEQVAQKVEELNWVKRKAVESFEHSQGLFLQEIIGQVIDQQEAAEEAGEQLTEFRIKVDSLPENAFLQTIRQVILNQCGLMGIETEVKRREAPPTVNVGVNVGVGVHVSFWDQLAGLASVEELPDRVEERIDACLRDPDLVYGLRELNDEDAVPGVPDGGGDPAGGAGAGGNGSESATGEGREPPDAAAAGAPGEPAPDNPDD